MRPNSSYEKKPLKSDISLYVFDIVLNVKLLSCDFSFLKDKQKLSPFLEKKIKNNLGAGSRS